MEVSVIGSAQVMPGRIDLGKRELGFCNSLSAENFSRKSKICFGRSIKWSEASVRLALKASVQSEAVVSEKVSGNTSTSRRRSEPVDGVRLYVGLPSDAVSDCNTVNHSRAIAAGLKALKLLGVDGVELPVWWGIVEKEGRGKYNWSSYLALADMVQKVGLKLHVSLCFHASKDPKIPLPEWVSQIGESQPSIFFTDRIGKSYKGCLSFAVDDLPVLNRKTPTEVYREFCEDFKSSFSAFMDSTIKGVSISLGPDGELRYPSHHSSLKSHNIPGVGEFQCYDQNMLNHLKQHAEASGNPLWGLSGPHDAPSYDQSPNLNNFCKEHGGSWESPYADFFLSWYSNQLIAHSNRMLSLVSSTFSDTPLTVSGKVPLMHSWYKTHSHPSELTAGFYNTVNRDGYEAVAEVFAKHSCKMILPGMDLSDEYQPQESSSSPELLLAQIMAACRKHGVDVSGQNSSVSGAPKAFEQIKKNLSGENAAIDIFTYQRMGAVFFSPDHFPSFTEFVRSLSQPELHADDLRIDKEETETADSRSEPSKDMQMQVA